MTEPAATTDGAAPQPDPTGGASLALTLVTLVAALSMGRLFDNGEFVVPFVLAALCGHWSARATRRVGLSLVTALPLSSACLALVVAWTLFPHTTAYGVPWAGTLHAAGDAVREAWTGFAAAEAPAPTTKGFLLAGMLGVGMAAVLADWAAFRLRAVFEATLPSFTLFVFTAVFGTPRHRTLSVAAYLGTLLLFVLVHQASIARESTPWFASRSRGGPAALARGGGLLAGTAVLAAVVVGPMLPGSSADPVIDWRAPDEQGPSRRTTLSPLVDIRGRLVEQSTSELFTVKANRAAYWRLTSLDTFDGAIWQSDDSYKPTDSSLPRGVPTSAQQDQVVQEFTIGSLSSIWLPAAYRPERIEGIRGASFNADTGSLITPSDTTDGYVYRVQSAIPRPTAAELGRAVPPLADEDLARYLDLPSIPARVHRLAAEITAGQRSPYAKARALQDFFQRRFRYDLKARAGHDGRALERFLFDSRRGYCEQFAGAYAVLARSIGLPARVAVGFTQGEQDPDGVYHVRGLNAHAWPEVFVAGYGWVYFEPTPGRGAPGTQDWTGLPNQQARADNPTVATTAPPTTAPAAVEAPAPDASTAGDSRVDTTGLRGPDRGLGHPLVLVLLVVLGLAALWTVVVPAARAVRRRRRRAAAVDARDRVLVAWAEAGEALARAGVARRAPETADEYARRATNAARLPEVAADALRRSARDMALAGYSAGPVSSEVARRAVSDAASVEAALRADATRRRRVRWALDPRPLWHARTRKRVVSRSHARPAA